MALATWLGFILATTAIAQTPPETEFDGIIEPHRIVELSTPVFGTIGAVYVERGDRVAVGQKVAQLESNVEQAEVELAQARANLTAIIEARSAQCGLAERKQQRLNELYQKQVATFDAKDEIETEAVLAAAELRQARQNSRVAALELNRAQQVLRQRTIVSPINGVVVERLSAPGEYVESNPIVKLAEIDPLRVEVFLPIALYGTVETGMRAQVIPEIQSDRTLVARIRAVDLVADAASGTFGVELELANPKQDIPAGLRCKVRFLPEHVAAENDVSMD